MRRLILTLAALAVVAGPLAVVDASAQPGRGRGQGQGQGRGQAQRQIERGNGARAQPPGLARERGFEGPPGLARGQREREERMPAPRYVPAPAYGDAAPREGVRRGGMLPPTYRGAPVYDPGRYRLRPPPPGYAWYRVGDDFLLVSEMSGLIFDVIRP